MFYWIFNKILPFFMIGGFISFMTEIGLDDVPTWLWVTEVVLGVIFAIIGGIYGRNAWDNDQPPRIFWVRSKNEEYDSKWKAIKDGAFTFFLIPANLFWVWLIWLCGKSIAEQM